MHEHTMKAFDTDMSVMRSAVMTMGGLVEQQVYRAVEVLRTGDGELMAQIATEERAVNRMHVQNDGLCNQIIARRQPIAIDLREVVAAMHTINDLERVGDEAKKIAYNARDLQEFPGCAGFPLDRVVAMGATVREMLQQALDAFVRHDAGVLTLLRARDRTVDALRSSLIRELLEAMAQDPASIPAAQEMIFIVQSLERIGDHAENIAEYVVNVVEGIDRRHASAQEES